VPKKTKPVARRTKSPKRPTSRRSTSASHSFAQQPGHDRRPLVEEVGRRIRALRVKRRGGRSTQGDVAGKARISISFLSMIERGERSPSVETLGDIAEALGVSLAEFFHEESSPPVLSPALRRIGEFVHERQLSRGEVDRLLSVADAIFSD
jgi:transcriptional regulator with XRE-family HTH domain